VVPFTWQPTPARPIGQDGHAACRRRPAWWRHPLDPPRRPRPHGGQPRCDKVDGRNAVWAKPLRIDPRTARGRHQLYTSAAILRVRSHYGIATSQQIDIPDSQRGPTTTAVASSDKRGSRCFSTCCRRRARCGGRIRRSCLGL